MDVPIANSSKFVFPSVTMPACVMRSTAVASKTGSKLSRIFEAHVDGRRFQWGTVLEWDPPGQVKFTFHPARRPEQAQDVEVRFLPEGSGTRLELTATRWENWGKGAARARKGYHAGWGYVLNVWAGRRTAGMSAMDLMAGVMLVVERLRGGVEATMARAGGEMPRA